MAGARLPPTLRDIVLAVDVDVDVEPHLPAGERHPVPERQQRVLQPVHQRLLELALRDPLRQRQVVEHVRVAHQLLRQLRVRSRLGWRQRRRRSAPDGTPATAPARR